MRISRFRTDATKENEGVWVPLGAPDDPDGFQLKIARLGNPAYEEMLRKIGKPYVRAIRMGTADPKVIADLQKKAMAKHVLKDWKGLQDDDGNPIPYSVEKAYELMSTLPDFFDLVYSLAQEQDLFRAQLQEDSAKNSETASAGS